MQALAERLDAALAGSGLERFELLRFWALKTVSPRPAELCGRRVGQVGRRGKYLVFGLGGPRLLVHLSQGGRVDLEDPPKATRPRGGVARLGFAGRPSVLVKELGRERRAEVWALASGEKGPLSALGPEPDSLHRARLSPTAVLARLARRAARSWPTDGSPGSSADVGPVGDGW